MRFLCTVRSRVKPGDGPRAEHAFAAFDVALPRDAAHRSSPIRRAINSAERRACNGPITRSA
jgi:hypothetical protein